MCFLCSCAYARDISGVYESQDGWVTIQKMTSKYLVTSESRDKNLAECGVQIVSEKKKNYLEYITPTGFDIIYLKKPKSIKVFYNRNTSGEQCERWGEGQLFHLIAGPRIIKP